MYEFSIALRSSQFDRAFSVQHLFEVAKLGTNFAQQFLLYAQNELR